MQGMGNACGHRDDPVKQWQRTQPPNLLALIVTKAERVTSSYLTVLSRHSSGDPEGKNRITTSDVIIYHDN